jgi:cytochrome c oxidase cbb3-type subunit 3
MGLRTLALHWLLASLVLIAGCRRPERAASRPERAASKSSAPPAVRYDQHVFAGGAPPPAGELRAPFEPGDSAAARAGKQLFAAMNCDGCHGGGGEGFVGPSLIDGRWRYGGNPEELYQTILYGRPRGMPAYGGVISPEGIWQLVAFIGSLPVRQDLTTERWKD